ncbi:MAG: hypothetical protein RL368_1399 [Pseudomonadota bacterium]|jgi:predicted  nucleic acid-binding Zn-ribbon protein
MNSGLRKLAAYFVSAALCWGVGSDVYAAEEGLLKDKRSFSTNRPQAERYDNDVHLQETLEFLGADCVEIKISGSSEKADILTIFIIHQEAKKFSGKVNTSLSIFDNKIGVEFRSNSYSTDKGFQVELLEKNIDRCLPEIREDFLKTARDILHHGASEITENLESSQSLLSNLNNKLRQNGSLESMLPDVVKTFLELANYYRKVTEKAPQIKSVLDSRQKTLAALQQRVTDIIERLNKAQAEYTGIAERDQLLESRTELQELKKKRLISADAYQKLAENVAIRKRVWEELHKQQYEVLKPLPLYLDNIQVLLHFMESHVPVYQNTASETVLNNGGLKNFNIKLAELRQAVAIIIEQELIIQNALKALGRGHEVTDKPR